MGQIAFIELFMLIVFPVDAYENRRHVHVYRKGKRTQEVLAKIWIETNGQKDLSVAYSKLTSKQERMILDAIERNWEYINQQITNTFEGRRVIVKNLK